MTTSELMNRVKEIEPYLIETRRYLHENPEVSRAEYKTAEFLKREVEKLGLPIEQVSNTGFLATLDTGKPGKTIALRTDIDALPVPEDEYNLKQKRIVMTKVPGVSHMCGHDGHMAILLSSMKILCDMRDQLTGKIIFLFEEAEENGGGIKQMLEKLKDKKIDAIYGNHLTSFMDTGTVCVDAGARMAGVIVINFDIVGKAGHGSRPDLSINPVFAGAQVLSGIASAWSNQLDVTKTVTLGITQFHAGSVHNTIPERASIGGTLRYFDYAEGEKALNVLKTVADYTAKAHNCHCEFADDMVITTIPILNDEKLANIALNSVESLYPQALQHDVTWFASESFSLYSKIAPSLFAFVGTRNEELGSGAEHHNEKFDLDEKSLPMGVAVMTKFAIDFLA